LGIIVQKFGGTSVADAECIKRAAAKAVRAKEQGHQVVVAVSAQAGMTDKLIALAHEITPDPDPREMDMLVSTGEQMSIALMCMTLHAMGHDAISLTGGQVGIETDGAHTKARIRRVKTEALRRELDRGRIIVVAGFQGKDEDDHITTLGRGASDLTAVALAAALHADMCEIYTDVDGIYTADPRVVSAAAKLDAVSHDEILELASVGAKVVQSRSVEVAKKFHVPLCVRSTFSDEPGTVVCGEVAGFEEVPVCGAAMSLKESRISITGLPDHPGVASKVVGSIGARNINLDMIIQSYPVAGKADMSFLVKTTDLREALVVSRRLAQDLGAEDVTYEEEIARVSVVGAGMIHHEGIAARMCLAIAEKGINVKMITTSEINISVVVDSSDGERALRAVHKAFDLDNLPKAIPVTDRPTVSSLTGEEAMEGLHVQFVDSDRDQAELKVTGLADKPGQAARVLELLAEAGIILDIVLQNSCSSGISVTVKRGDIEKALQTLEALKPDMTNDPVIVSSDICKVSISGVGLRSHAGAASKVFGLLADAGINIKMIGTSEVKISVIVPEKDCDRAVEILNQGLSET
jgi:aspartate kinase